MARRTGRAALDEYARIGGVLRAAREGLGYTQLRLAGEIGVSEGTYSRYEAGKQKITIPELKRVAALLDLPLEAVLGEPAGGPPLVPDVAHRVADLVAERLPAIVRAVLAEERIGRAGHHGGRLGAKSTGNTDEKDEAFPFRRPGWVVTDGLMAAAG